MSSNTKVAAVLRDAAGATKAPEKPARRNWKKDYETLNKSFIDLGLSYFYLENGFDELIEESNEFAEVVAGIIYEVTGALCDLEDRILDAGIFSRTPKKVMGKSAEGLNRAVISYNNFVDKMRAKYEEAAALIEATDEDPADDAEE